jgi:hypothetical protein
METVLLVSSLPPKLAQFVAPVDHVREGGASAPRLICGLHPLIRDEFVAKAERVFCPEAWIASTRPRRRLPVAAGAMDD